MKKNAQMSYKFMKLYYGYDSGILFVRILIKFLSAAM